MKLEKFKQRDPKKIGITIFTVACILLIAGVFFYTSFASFEVKEDFNIINGTVGDPGDLYFAFYVDGVISKDMPQKGEGYVIDQEKTTCNNGASVEFNTDDWSVKVVNMTKSRTKCTLHFKKYIPPAAETILAKGETDELKFDNTADNNLRYVGANPNNYVSFNNELWRIIGAFNNIDDGTGKKETRLKIIRSEPIGNYGWDNKASGTGSSDSSNGSNDWSDSALQIVLNEGAYWNRTSGECPSGSNGKTTSCDFTSTGLTEEAKSMIGNAKWNLGGVSSESNIASISSSFYTSERGTTVYAGRPTEWIGKIGLMYPSDYGYATSGGSTTNRETCLNTELYNWDGSSVSDCKDNDWLYDSSNSQWTITPKSSNSSGVFFLYRAGNVSTYSARSSGTVSPALYLSSNVKISGGEGTESSPYQLSL